MAWHWCGRMLQEVSAHRQETAHGLLYCKLLICAMLCRCCCCCIPLNQLKDGGVRPDTQRFLAPLLMGIESGQSAYGLGIHTDSPSLSVRHSPSSQVPKRQDVCTLVTSSCHLTSPHVGHLKVLDPLDPSCPHIRSPL